MKVFGPVWEDYHQKISDHWQSIIHEGDLVLIPGDISWAMRLDEAFADLEFIDKLKGKKVLIRGNHDYWWPTLGKLQKLPFKTLSYIHNNALLMDEVAICGARLWDSDEYNFSEFVDYKQNPKQKEKVPVDNQRIFENELKRLEQSIKELDKHALIKIGMTHYPPIGKSLQPSKASALFEQAGISDVCFGHLHSLKRSIIPFGSARGVNYHFCSADEVNFIPQRIL